MPSAKRAHENAADVPPARSTRSHSKGVSQGTFQDTSQDAPAREKRRKKNREAATVRTVERAKMNGEHVLQDTRRMADNERRRQQRAGKKMKDDNAAKNSQRKADEASKSAGDMRSRAEAARRRRQAMQPALDTSGSADNNFSCSPRIIVGSSSPAPISPSPPRSGAMILPATSTGNTVTRNRLQSSPPLVSSPPLRWPNFDVAVTYSLYVNTVRKVREDAIPVPREMFNFVLVEDTIEKLIASPKSTVDGREYTYLSRTVMSKVGKSSRFQHTNLEDFSESESRKVWDKVDLELSTRNTKKRLAPIVVNLSVEVRIHVPAYAKAIVCTTGDSSLDPPITTPFRKTTTGSSDDDSSSRTASLFKMLERQTLLNLMEQIAAPAQIVAPAPYPHYTPHYPFHLYPPQAGHAAPPPQHPALQENISSRVAGSSPIPWNRTDSRAIVKVFFTWLIEHAEDKVKDEYERTRDIAVEEMWTIADLKDMSALGSNLYRMATSEPHKLKDGIVRHLRDDLRRFKHIYRLQDS